MSNSGEESPDWLRSYKAPSTSSLSLSSPDDSPYRLSDDSDADETLEECLSRRKSKTKKVKANLNLEEKPNGNNVDGEDISIKHKDAHGGDDCVLLLSSDSEQPSPIKEEAITSTERDEDFVIEAKEEEPAVKKGPKKNSPKQKPTSVSQTLKKENSEQELKTEDKDTDPIVSEEVKTDKNSKSTSGASSRLPLVLSEKVNRSKVLVECEGDTIDLSGDMGAVGRVVVSDTTEDVYLDLKGTIYKSTIVPCRTFCVVNVGQTEAKIEAIMNDFIQLTPQSNVYEAETMVEGTLEGFSFDSDDEAKQNARTASKPADQSGGAEEVTNSKAKAKGEKVAGKKRGSQSKVKQPPAKKARTSAPKKPKSKK